MVEEGGWWAGGRAQTGKTARWRARGVLRLLLLPRPLGRASPYTQQTEIIQRAPPSDRYLTQRSIRTCTLDYVK